MSVQQGPPAEGTEGQGGVARFNAPADLDSIDPALATGTASQQLEYATCVKLLNYPDAPAPAGSRLVPEVAAAMPIRSADGRRYTFTIRKGLRFSPPSGEPITAETFRHTLERALSPRVQHPPAGPAMTDIVGATAYEAGRASHVEGIVATGDRLTIRLTRPAPDLLARLAFPTFCAVPTATPISPQTVAPIPSAGPYYIASYVPNQEIVLARNPNYHGARPHRLDKITYTLGIDPKQTVAQIEAGQADYAVAGFIPGGLPPSSIPELSARYGPRSPAARAGHQQYFESPSLGEIWIALNPNRPLFADAALRRAVAYAIDRPALSRDSDYAFRPDDHLLPPVLPGYEHVHLYPLSRPDLKKARRLAARHGGLAIMYACSGCNEQLIQRELARIGIDVVVKEFPVAEFLQRVKTPGEHVDLFQGGTTNGYYDPVEFLNHVLVGHSIAALAPHDRSLSRKLANAARLSAAARERAYGRLDVEIARDAYLVPLGYTTTQDFFSATIGCQLDHPVYGMDLAAICRRH